MRRDSYIAWCNENEGRAYPLSETATRVDDAGERMADDLLVDIGLSIPREYAGLRIGSCVVSDDILAISINAGDVGLLAATFVRSAIRPYVAYPFTGLADDVGGWVAFGNHIGPRGCYRFSSAAQSGLESRVARVIPPPGVKRFRRTGNDVGLYATGIVELKPGQAFVVERDPAVPNNIVLRLLTDTRSRFCEPCTRVASAKNCETPPLRTINGVPANADGEIVLRFE